MQTRRPRTVATLGALALAAVVLAGCGGIFSFPGENREAWRAMAEDACLRSGKVAFGNGIRPGRPIRERRVCGTRRPLEVTAFAGGTVRLSREATLTCPMVPATEAWLASAVQPAALELLGSPVVEIDVVGDYTCRRRNNGNRRARISEHAFANAIDIAGFRLADGREIKLIEGWNGDPFEGLFLRRVHGEACRHFTTVIGPDGDRFHRDHFHFDLARHSKDGLYRHCE